MMSGHFLWRRSRLVFLQKSTSRSGSFSVKSRSSWLICRCLTSSLVRDQLRNMFSGFTDNDLDRCALWVKDSPPGPVSGVSRLRRCWFPALMVAVIFVLIVVLGVTNRRTWERLRSSEEEVSSLTTWVESLNASLQQSQESIKDVPLLQKSIQDNKQRLASALGVLQQLAVLNSLSRKVDALKCSLERFINNGSTAGPCCPMDWTPFGSDCFFFSHQNLPWNQSQSWCEKNDANLVMLHTDQEWDFVTKNSVPHLYWVGLTDGRTGKWEWVNRTPYTIQRRRWAPGQPDSWSGHGLGPGDEDCAHLHADGRLNDLHCSSSLRFICQRRSVLT